MKTNPPIVRCTFAEDGEALSVLVESAFRLYLQDILANQTAPIASDRAPKEDDHVL